MYSLGAKRRFPAATGCRRPPRGAAGLRPLAGRSSLQRCGQTHRQPSARVCAQRAEPAFSGYPSFSARLTVLVHRRRKANDSPVCRVNQSWYRDSVSERKGPATPTEPAGALAADGACGYYSGMVLRLLRASGGMADALASGASVLRDVGVQVPFAHRTVRRVVTDIVVETAAMGVVGTASARPRPAQGNPGIDVTIAGAVRFSSVAAAAGWRGASVPFTRRASRSASSPLVAPYRLSRRRLAGRH